MQFIDLKEQYLKIKSDLDARIHKVLDHGFYIGGPEIAEIEKVLADYVGVKHCIALASGTDALLIPMMALGIGAGDEVITTPFTFIATAETIALLGAKPVFVDIDPKTYNIDVTKIEKAITKKTKMIMPVSLYGQCADMDAINAIAAKHNIPVLEDAAQSFGATYKGIKSCNLSLVAATSFFPAKPLGCYGDGGASFTNYDSLAKAIQEIRNHGQEKRYCHTRVGLNGRFDTMQAAVLLAKMKIFPSEVIAREKAAAEYNRLLNGHVRTPFIEAFNTSVYAQYTIEVSNRDSLQNKLNTLGIPTAVHYPIPLHKQPVFAKHYPDLVLPFAEAAAEKVMSLPMHPYLDKDTIETICKGIIE
jgi:UDP-2-acetamido-2-deoxy-ribo-hexuluronate aminotransferase